MFPKNVCDILNQPFCYMFGAKMNVRLIVAIFIVFCSFTLPFSSRFSVRHRLGNRMFAKKTGKFITPELISAVEAQLETAKLPEVAIQKSVDSKKTSRTEAPSSRIRIASGNGQPNFAMIGLDKVSISLGSNELVKNSSFTVATGERLGIVGPNGCGKTTQLKVLFGDYEPTTGSIVKSSENLKVAYLRQEFIDQMNLNSTLKQELMTLFEEESEILEKIEKLEEALKTSQADADQRSTTEGELVSLRAQAKRDGIYQINSKIMKMIALMGFSEEDVDRLVKNFSGGWKMRIGLCKALLQEP